MKNLNQHFKTPAPGYGSLPRLPKSPGITTNSFTSWSRRDLPAGAISVSRRYRTSNTMEILCWLSASFIFAIGCVLTLLRSRLRIDVRRCILDGMAIVCLSMILRYGPWWRLGRHRRNVLILRSERPIVGAGAGRRLSQRRIRLTKSRAGSGLSFVRRGSGLMRVVLVCVGMARRIRRGGFL